MVTTNTMKRVGMLAAVAASSLALAACGAPNPPVGPVDLRSGGSVAAPAPSPAPGPAAPQSLDGVYPVWAGGAGTVTFAVSGGRVALQDVALEPGWRRTGERQGEREVEVRLTDGTSTVTVEGELDEGRFKTDMDLETPPVPGRVEYPVGDAGTVTIDVRPDGVGLVGQEAAAGWVATVDADDLREGQVEIHFRNDGAGRSVAFDAGIDDGLLNVDIDERAGADHFVRGPGR